MSILKAVTTVGVFTALSRIFGLVREILLSHILGASAVTDAFFVAFKFPNFFRRLFAEGAFNAAFVPHFSQTLEGEGQCAAQETAQHIFSVLATVLCAFVLVVIIATPWIIHVLAPGFATTPERLEMAICFIRITFSYIFLISLAAHLSGILNSLNRFAVAAGVPVLLNITMISALFWASSTDASALETGTLLCWSVLAGGVLQFGWLHYTCSRLGFKMIWRRPCLTPDVKKILKLMLPGMIGAGVMNINFFVDTIVASFLPEKSLSFLYYADRLNQLPLSIFGIAMGTALLPLLSRQLKAGAYEEAATSQSTAVFFALQVALPAAVGLIVLAHPLIQTIYGLSAQDTLATAHALAAFALGIPAYVLTKIFSASFFARQDTKTPVIVGGICIASNVALTLLLAAPLQHVGLALATALSAWINAVLLYATLHRRKWYTLPQHIFWVLGKIALSCLLMAAGVWGLDLILTQTFEIRGVFEKMLYLTAVTGAGVVLFLITGAIFGTFNMHQLRAMMRR